VQPVREAAHRTLYRDPHAYCAHPHAVALPNGDWLVVFNHSVRRSVVLHPPEDPLYRNLIMRSLDQGQSWSAPLVVPGYDWHGVECAGLTALRDGHVLLNQWRFRWYPLPTARKLAASTTLTFPDRLAAGLVASPEHAIERERQAFVESQMPWARGPGDAYVHRSDDGGLTWDGSVRLDTAPFEGGYGMRGAVALPDGTLMLPLCDVPSYERVYVVHSRDGGTSWGLPVAAAIQPDKLFEEPCALALPSGEIVMLLRENRSRHLHQATSADGGHTWSQPVPTPIDGYPAHLLHLSDGRLLCTYGYRKPPYGIRAVLSEDQGASWNVDATLEIRRLPNRDLGYPCTLAMTDGRLCSFYYGQNEGVTGIESTVFAL
jgi:hypothetical protein